MSLNPCYSCGCSSIEWDEIPERYEDPASYIYACPRCDLQTHKYTNMTLARQAWQAKNVDWTTVRSYTEQPV